MDLLKPMDVTAVHRVLVEAEAGCLSYYQEVEVCLAISPAPQPLVEAPVARLMRMGLLARFTGKQRPKGPVPGF